MTISRPNESDDAIQRHVEYEQPIRTLIFGNRMRGTLEVSTEHTSNKTILDLSEAAARELKFGPSSNGTLIFTRKRPSFSFFRSKRENNEDGEITVKVRVPQNTLHTAITYGRNANIILKNYVTEKLRVQTVWNGTAYLENIQCDSLLYEASAGGIIMANGLEVEALQGRVQGFSNVSLQGKTKSHKVDTFAIATVIAEQLDTVHAEVRCSRTSRVMLGSVRTLDVHTLQKSRVLVNGSPELKSVNQSPKSKLLIRKMSVSF